MKKKSGKVDILASSLFQLIMKKFASIKDKYGDDYPIVFYDPQIKFEEKKAFRHMVEENSSINLFWDLGDALLKFADSLGIGFIMIVPSDYEEAELFQVSRYLKYIYERRMFDFEEEAFLKDLFKNTSDQIIKSMKVYVFCTLLEYVTDVDDKEDEEEVMEMCDIKDIAKEFRQEFTFIWYDPDLSPESKQTLEEEIDIKIEEKNMYTEFADLYERLKSYNGTPYHLIMSRSERAESFLKEISQHKDLLGLYIYCENFEMEKKIDQERVEIRSTIKELVPRIKEGIRTRSKLKNALPAFVTNFDISDRTEFYKLHYYLKGFINFKNRKQAQADFIKLARKIYQDQDKELSRFEEKYNEYSKGEILRWYTRDSPIYRLINNCLRIASSDSILYCRLILRDLERAIREQYQEKSKCFSGLVYRGAYISTEEWEKLQRNIGKEIEMSGFLSTSANQETARNFLKADLQNKVLIKIIIPHLPRLDEQGFANVSEFSEFKNEQEILFNVRSRFQILEAGVSKTDNRGTKYRQLVLLYGAQSLRRYITKEKPSMIIKLELPPDVKCHLCGSRERLLGYYDQGETFVNCLECIIKGSMPKDTPLVAVNGEENTWIFRNLEGRILASKEGITFSNCGYKCHDCEAQDKEKYFKWLSCDDKNNTITQCSECLEKNKIIKDRILLLEGSPYAMWQEQQKEWEQINRDYQGVISQDIGDQTQGSVFLEVQEYQKCIEYGKKVILKFKNKRRRELSKLNIFHILGGALRDVENPQLALRYLKTCLNITQFIGGAKSEVGAILSRKIAKIYENLHEHYKGLEYYDRSLDLQISLDGENHEGSAMSYHGMARIYKSLNHYESAFAFYNKTIEILKTVSLENHPEMAAVYHNIASLYRHMGKYEIAIPYFNAAIRINEAIYGGKHSSTAASYNSLSSLYQSLGEYQKALDYLNKALDIQTSIFGTNHPALVDIINNLGIIHQTMGRYQEALEHFYKALDIERSVSGGKSSSSTNFFGNIGIVYQRMGNHQKSLKYFFKSLNLKRLIFGGKHADLVTSYNNIGSAYRNLGKFTEALEYGQNALKLQKLLDPKHHPGIATISHNLALLYKDLGEYEKAIKFNRKTLKIRIALTGEMHLDVAGTYNNLATVYVELGQYDQAFESLEKALNILKSVHGTKHADVALVYNNIATIHIKLGRYHQGLEYQKKALDIQRSILDENHPDLMISESNLGSVYERLGEYQKALEIFTKVLEKRKLVSGELHPDTAMSYDNLGKLNGNLENIQQSFELHMKALDVKKSIYPEKHPEIAKSFNYLASVFVCFEKYKEAKTYLVEALNIQKLVYTTEKHPEIASSYNNLAFVCLTLEEYSEAVEYFEKAIDLKNSIFGEKDGETAESYDYLGTSYYGLGKYQKAKENFFNAIDILKSLYGEQCRKLASPYVGLSAVYRDLGDYQTERKYHEKAFELDSDLVKRTLL